MVRYTHALSTSKISGLFLFNITRGCNLYAHAFFWRLLICMRMRYIKSLPLTLTWALRRTRTVYDMRGLYVTAFFGPGGPNFTPDLIYRDTRIAVASYPGPSGRKGLGTKALASFALRTSAYLRLALPCHNVSSFIQTSLYLWMRQGQIIEVIFANMGILWEEWHLQHTDCFQEERE